ncbi:uncharacterized protein [Ptychodera flava]|uniref:uncharacterized protein n=1 Tax=Ptychodera flava TaxID=63121 RepID=UPI00396A706A
MEFDNVFLLGVLSILFTLVSGAAEWPTGLYALFMPQTGCPGPSDVWQTTSIYLNLTSSMTDSIFSFGKQTHLSFEKQPDYFRVEICSRAQGDFYTDNKREKPAIGTWPEGGYCILNVGESEPITGLAGSRSQNISNHTTPTARGRRCPNGFREGSLSWPFQLTLIEGRLSPYGYEDDVLKSFYCCQDPGFHDRVIELPSWHPFYLLQQGDYCQQVKNMAVSAEIVEWRFQTTTRGTEMSSGSHPFTVEGRSYRKEYFCYYTPVTNTEKGVGYAIRKDVVRNSTVNTTAGVQLLLADNGEDLPPPPDFTDIKIAVGVVVLGTPTVTLLVLCICRIRNIQMKKKLLKRDSYRMTSFTYQSSFTTRRYSNSPPSSDVTDKPQREYTYRFQNHRLGVRNSNLRCEV